MKKSFALFLFCLLSLSSFAQNHLPPKNLKIVMMGDSLTEGYGVSQSAAFPVLVQKKLSERLPNYKIEVINSGIGGSTTASALKRLQWVMKSKPDYLFLALGANDGLRGVPVVESKKNLGHTIEFAQKEGIKVWLAGMKMPPNYGKDYTQSFLSMYQDLAKKYKLALLPFLLEGVAGVKDLNLQDGIHPNEKGHELIAQTVSDFIIKQVGKQ